MKKKILTLTLCMAMLATVAISGTLAYFTDTDDKTNTFTIGNINITLEEEFDKENAKLIPGKGNAINKDVSIKNEKDSLPSYVWYEWYIPTVLDSTDKSTGTNNILHVNSLGATWDKYRENEAYWAEDQTEAYAEDVTWDHDPNEEITTLTGPEGYIRQETVDGIQYNVYLALYKGILEPNGTTTQAMDQAYLDPKVDFDGDSYTINGKEIDFNFDEGINIIVKAFGIQADGLTDTDNDGDVDVYDAYLLYTAQAKAVADANTNNG